MESVFTSQCFKVHEGDRLGLYFPVSPGAIPYRYDFGNPASFQHRVDNVSDPIKLREKIMFDPLSFPYDFSVAVYLDISKYTFHFSFKLMIQNYFNKWENMGKNGKIWTSQAIVLA